MRNAQAPLLLPTDLAQRCLEHFGQEERCLASLAQGLEAQHAALSAGRWRDLAGLLSGLDPLVAERQRLFAARQELWVAVAQRCQTAAAAFSLAALQVPSGLAERWRALTRRLVALGKELERLSAAVAFLVHHHADFLQDMLAFLTQGPPEALRYGPRGQLTAAARGTLLQATGDPMSAATTIGLSSLLVSQRLLDLTGQNIANAGTPGYHRQVASLAMLSGGVEIGLGVEITQVRRLIDLSLENAITRNVFAQNDVDAQLETIRHVESFLQLGTGSIGALWEDLLNQAAALAGQPNDSAQRRVFLDKAVALVGQINDLHGNIDSVRRDLPGRLQGGVAEVNRLAQSVAELNTAIERTTIQGGNANELSDRRDQLINQLAEWIDVRVVEQKFGSVNVMAAGVPLVLGSQSIELRMQFDGSGQAILSPENLTSGLATTGGRLHAWLQDYNQTLPELQQGLESWTRSLAQTLDGLQATGLGQAGPFTLLHGLRAVDNVNLPLAQAGLDFPPQAGSVFVSVTNQATGARTLHEVVINPNTQSLQNIASALSTIPHLQGLVDAQSRTLTVVAQPGYAFDFAGRLPTAPQASTLSGTATASLAGHYQGAANDEFIFTVVGTGTVGVSAGLTLEARNSAGALLASFNIGQGYEPGTELPTVQGVRVGLASGTVNNGETFRTQVVGDPDEAGLLTALGVNVFFQQTHAGAIQVRADLLDQPDLLSHSRTGLPADGSNWQRLLTLADEPSLAGGVSLRDYFGQLAAEVGARAQNLDQTQTAQRALGQGLAAERQSVSGVDPNEELTRLLQYQRSFQLSARYLSVVNETLDDLLRLA